MWIQIVSFSDFVSFVGIPVGIASFTATIKICAITAGIKNYYSIIKKKKQYNSIDSKNTIEVKYHKGFNL